MKEKLGAGIILLPNMTERQWNTNERIEKWHIEAIAQKGFESITIESAWEDYMDKNDYIFIKRTIFIGEATDNFLPYSR